MKRVLLVILLLVAVFMCGSSYAATKEDVISAMKKTYIVGDSTFQLPSSVVKKAENYFSKSNLTEEQYDNIMYNINGLVSLAQKNGTINPDEVSIEDKMKAFDMIADASESANIDLDKALADSNIVIEIPNKNVTTEKDNVTNKSNSEKNEETPRKSNDDKKEEVPNKSTGENQEIKEPEIVDTNLNEADSEPSESTNTISLNDIIPVSDDKNNSGSIAKEVNVKFNKYATLVVIGLTVVIFINFLIIYLIFKSKWNRIIKYIFIVVFIVAVLVILAALIYGLIKLEKIRAVYKLYYILK